MRVIAGAAGGRPLRAPKGDRTRPTSDRVREAVFNALGSRLDWAGVRVVDLFAGSGALGIEALSRGADSAVFVDHDPGARRTIAENLDVTGFTGRATVLAGDAVAAAAAFGPGSVDVAFCDPPYRFDGWAPLLDGLARAGVGLVVLESDHEVALPDGWGSLRTKRYGSTVVLFARPGGGDLDGSEPEQE